MSRHLFVANRPRHRATRAISARPLVVVVSALSLLAGILVAPTAANAATAFPTPSHQIDPSYQDVTGTHVVVTEPTITISSWDETEPEGGFPDYDVDLELAATESTPLLATEVLDTVRDGASSHVTWPVPAGLLSFGETYVLRYRLVANGQQSDWVGWLPFAVTAPSSAPTLVSPAAGALSTNQVELVAQVPNYIATPNAYDSIIFTVQEAWQNGEPLTVSQLSGEIGPDGIARTSFSTNAWEGQYRWNAQWVGAGFSEPSEFRELTISRKAPPVQYVYVAPNRSSATVNWNIPGLQFAPIEYVDVTLTPGNVTRRVPPTSASTTFTDLALGDYTASITTTNALGTSAPVVEPFTVVATSPSSPTNLTAAVTNGGTRAHLSWNPPANDGGAPVTQYFVIVRSYDGGGSQSFYTSELAADIDVATGFTYVILVYAGNAVSLGDLAFTRLEVFGVPSVPRNLEVKPGDGFVNVYWDIPENIGGKWPTKYRVTVQGAGTHTVTAYYARMGIQINDLENGHPYTINVRAINEIGAGVVAKLTNVIPVASEADADADGLPDVVEARFGTSSSLSDTDNDGISDLDETLKLSAFLSPTIADTDDDGIIDADEDSDDDGITNVSEISGGINPSSPDSDHDSIADAAELASSTNPLASDSDADGVEDASELASGLNPNAADTNGDGTFDNETVATQNIVDLTQYEPQTGQFIEPEVNLASEVSGAVATVIGVAGRLDDIAVSSSPPDELIGAVTAVAEVVDHGAAPMPEQGPSIAAISTSPAPSVSQLSFNYSANVSPARLQELAPVTWNPDTYSWEFVDNDVSLSTATRTITIVSPELGLRYAVVDLRSWRAHISECDNGSTGRPQLDVEFVIDEMPSVIAGDATNERFTAARAVLDSLSPGDTATVREFGLVGIGYSGGSGSGPGSWDFSSDLSASQLTEQQTFGLSPLEHARAELDVLDQEWGPNDISMMPTGVDVGWDPERVLVRSKPDAPETNPYVPTATPLVCRKKVVVLITDGETDGKIYSYGWEHQDPDPNHPFSETDVPVHVLDLGIGDPGSSDWMTQLAEDTDGTYSYVPTASDLAGWIDDVAPRDWQLGDPNKDTDHDTIPDMVETYGISATLARPGANNGHRFYSNPRKADSDADGIPDNLEVGQRLAIGTQGAAWTTATINRNYWVISDPGSKDGDDDGLDDRAEIDLGMNPLVGDGDGDGLLDSDEEMNGTFAQMYDTDSDGFSDAYEVYHNGDGYDPREYTPRVSEYEWLSEAAVGFFCGEVDICSMSTIPWLVGNVASGLLIFGDLRDGIALIVKGDFVSAAFCLVGLIPAIGDVAGTIAKIVKFVRKIIAPFGFRATGVVSAAGAGVAANAALNSAQAIKLLAQYANTPKKFVQELVKLEPQMVDALKTTHKLTDSGITKLVTKNGIDRIKAYAMLQPPKVRRYAYTAATLPKFASNGKAGETALLKVVPQLVGYKQVRDLVEMRQNGVPVQIARYWDGKYVAGDVTHYFEAKVGYVASGHSYAQLAKEIARKKAETTGVFEWHFYASSITGKIGPSLPFLRALNDAGITAVFHFPGGTL